jgi:hypothetical protein
VFLVTPRFETAGGRKSSSLRGSAVGRLVERQQVANARLRPSLRD